jgi:hypothetical protein
MEDSLEKFIIDNRERFDSRDPDPALLKKVEAGLRRTRRFGTGTILRRVAVVLLIFAASYGVNEVVHRIHDGTKTARRSDVRPPENAIPGFNETEAYYAGLLSRKMDELKPIIANCPSLEEELNFDLSELDSIYSDLKKDLKDNLDNQEVIEAIIENYRLKISILEDLLTEIKPTDDQCLSNIDEYAL